MGGRRRSHREQERWRRLGQGLSVSASCALRCSARLGLLHLSLPCLPSLIRSWIKAGLDEEEQGCSGRVREGLRTRSPGLLSRAPLAHRRESELVHSREAQAGGCLRVELRRAAARENLCAAVCLSPSTFILSSQERRSGEELRRRRTRRWRTSASRASLSEVALASSDRSFAFVWPAHGLFAHELRGTHRMTLGRSSSSGTRRPGNLWKPETEDGTGVLLTLPVPRTRTLTNPLLPYPALHPPPSSLPLPFPSPPPLRPIPLSRPPRTLSLPPPLSLPLPFPSPHGYRQAVRAQMGWCPRRTSFGPRWQSRVRSGQEGLLEGGRGD